MTPTCSDPECNAPADHETRNDDIEWEPVCDLHAVKSYEAGLAVRPRGGHPITDSGQPTEDPTVCLTLDTADTLLEAAGTVRDDIASGRQWAWPGEDVQDNAADLDEAFHQLRLQLREVDDA